jgi:ubiquinone/menaquinone biosynthesis C-methylase UbiE
MGLLLKRCPARLAILLEHPLRQRLLRIDRLVESLRLQPGSRVLDLGAGSGVVAGAVATKLQRGALILVDPQIKMLIRARRRLAHLAMPTLDCVAGIAEQIPLRDESVDLVLLVTVLGEVDDAVLALQEVHRVLRPRGVVSISEHLPDPDFRTAAATRTLLRTCGFEEREFIGSRWSYTCNFIKSAPVAA